MAIAVVSVVYIYLLAPGSWWEMGSWQLGGKWVLHTLASMALPTLGDARKQLWRVGRGTMWCAGGPTCWAASLGAVICT